MGAWGIGNFENDGSHDWLIEFTEQQSKELLEAAFQTAIDSADDYLEVDECHAVLAAAEVIAASLGKRCSDFPDNGSAELDLSQVRSWIDESLLAAAQKAIERVVGNDSELQELWDESGDLSTWLAVVEDLKTRLEHVS